MIEGEALYSILRLRRGGAVGGEERRGAGAEKEETSFKSSMTVDKMEAGGLPYYLRNCHRWVGT